MSEVLQTSFTLQPHTRGCYLITDEIEMHLPALPEKGLLQLFIQHTSAALSLNENADPDVQTDLNQALNRMVPENNALYLHTCEGPDDMPAHIKSSMIGASLTIPITNRKLNLGVWQGIYLCEFRNHSSGRHIVATILS